ncbi:hypothetical protein Tco_0260044 [Tanacetum coccineum]
MFQKLQTTIRVEREMKQDVLERVVSNARVDLLEISKDSLEDMRVLAMGHKLIGSDERRYREDSLGARLSTTPQFSKRGRCMKPALPSTVHFICCTHHLADFQTIATTLIQGTSTGKSTEFPIVTMP